MTQPRPFHLPTSLADIASSDRDQEGGQTPSEGSTSPLYPSRQRRFAVHNRNFRSPPTSSKGRTSEGRQMNEAASTSNLYTTHTVDSSAPGGEVAPTPVTPAENVPEIINRHTDAGPVIMTDNNISPSSPRIIDLPPRYEDAAPPTPSLDLTSPQPSQQPSLRR
ncbi:hypothetical protein FRC03_001984 [Tulasnella sp. 419]|nr:hypothetical protein FRC03_001984 [Tulasnella sp. 419]